MRIDLDAARAARREAAGEGPVVIIDGKELTLPPEMPFQAAADMAEVAVAQEAKNEAKVAAIITSVVKSLLGPSYDDFMRAQPSIADLTVFVDGIAKAYGMDGLGESQASAPSS